MNIDNQLLQSAGWMNIKIFKPNLEYMHGNSNYGLSEMNYELFRRHSRSY